MPVNLNNGTQIGVAYKSYYSDLLSGITTSKNIWTYQGTGNVTAATTPLTISTTPIFTQTFVSTRFSRDFLQRYYGYPTASYDTDRTYRWPNDWATQQLQPPTLVTPKPVNQTLARKKARNLLKENLSAAQWKEFLKLDYFEIVAESGAVYRIKNGRSRNVLRIVNGEPVEILCAHPSIGCPNEDTMLAQKLILETDEQLFRKTANIETLSKKKEIPNSYQMILNQLQIGLAA